MQNTGRIQSSLSVSARRLLFESAIDGQLSHEMPYFALVDRAHLVMLSEQKIIPAGQAARLIGAIEELEDARFAPLRGLPATRGLFLLYEDYLIEKLGARTGGILQTARSRNDLSATVLKLRIRSLYSRLMRECLKLQAILLEKARRYARLTMPIYTHGQPGMPGTYGHYLLAVAQALERDLDGIENAVNGLAVCPLGANAVGGTSLAICTARTAQLLGFDSGPPSSVDAVASRDMVTRLLAASAIFGITLSRLAGDFFQWTTQEFQFLRLPDQLVGSSSAMPQKRNPFLLEHVKGRSASALGAFIASATAMHSTPFTNSVAVGTEAVRPLWSAIEDIIVASTLLRIMVAGALPDASNMMKSVTRGLVTATEVANYIVGCGNVDYRTAHRLVGEAIHAAMGQEPSLESVLIHLKSRGISIAEDQLFDPLAVALRSEYGGGPGSRSFQLCFEQVRSARAERKKRLRDLEQHWAEAEASLRRLSQNMCRFDKASA